MAKQKSKRNEGRYTYKREYTIYDPQGKVVTRVSDHKDAIDLTFALNVKRDDDILSGKLIVSLEEQAKAKRRRHARIKEARRRGEIPPPLPREYKTSLEQRLQQREYSNRYNVRRRGGVVGLTKKQQEEVLEKKRASARARSARYRERKKNSE